MRKILTLVVLFTTITLFSQTQKGKFLDEIIQPLIEKMKAGELSKETIKETLNETIKNPELYDQAWKQIIDYVIQQDSAWNFLNDLNIKFKTFQSVDQLSSSLGVTYNFNFNYAKFTKKEKYRTSNALSLKLNGNVAFNRDINPNDFLESAIHYSFSKFFGGVAKKNTIEEAKKLMEINQKIALKNDDKSQYSQDLFKERAKYIKFSDQYYIGFDGKLSLESNQDFTKKQYVYGGSLQLGAKAWDNSSSLARFNALDYPFALLRWITGTDQSFEPYGATLPTLVLGLDHVDPIGDYQRKNILGNLDTFRRMNIASSFRTFISRVHSENIFFSANVRYYKELDANALIKAANLDEYFYFVMALQSTSGFYVSYAKGTLPFDARNDEVYAVGFHYKF